jgi:multiple sugar transport system substrate-binding protein
MPSDVLGMDYDAVNAQVQQGLTAYAWNWNAYLPAVLDPEKSTVSDKIGFSLTPAGPNGQPQGLGGWTMGISSQSAQKEAAFQLLQFLSGKNRGPALALAGGSVARYSVAEDPAVSQAFPYYPLLLEAMGNVAVRGSDRSWAEAQRTIGVGLSEILLGEDAQAGLVDTAGEVYDQEQKAGYTPEATGPRPGS